jgi:hypothetical protein
VRETSKKINNYSWNRRDNGTPGAKSEKFRKHYISGPSQNPMQDNILIYTANFEINMSLKNATPGRILIETEKLMLRHLAERHVEYVKKQDLSKENPLQSELSAEEVLVAKLVWKEPTIPPVKKNVLTGKNTRHLPTLL